MTYRELTLYSPLHDCEMTRLSMTDGRNGEYWMLVPRHGRGWRERRSEALQMLADAIASGCQPGEVNSGGEWTGGRAAASALPFARMSTSPSPERSLPPGLAG